MYFRAAMVGYVLALGTTIAVMNFFNAAQPALLYIVPGLLAAVLGLAAARGEFNEVFYWEEVPEGVEGEEGKDEGDEQLPPSTAAAARAEPKKVK